MSELARRLRSAREARGVMLDEVSHATKIKQRYLEAIDLGDFDSLPEGPPARGFIRIYARYLGLDPDQALADFEAEVGVPITQLNEVIPPPPARQPAVSRYTQTVKVQTVRWKGELPAPDQAELDLLAEQDGLMAPQPHANRELEPLQAATPVAPAGRTSLRSSFTLKVPKPPPDGSEADLALSPRRPSYRLMSSPAIGRAALFGAGGVAAVVALVAVIALVIVPAFRSTPQRPTTAIAPADIPVTVVSLLPTAAAEPDAAQTAQAPQAEPVAAGAAAQTAPTPEPAPPQAPVVIPTLEGGGVELILDARERAWVRVFVDGNVVYEGIPAIGPNVRWRGQTSVGFETGNAGAFEVIVNGVRIGTAGPRNKITKLTWDAAGNVTEG